MKNPLVSIITPCYNSEKFIAQTIHSVQNQTYINWEMILVDDASTDSTLLLARQIAAQDKRIKIFTLKKNSGAGITRNTALDKTSGRYIAFLDADDLWKPDKLEKQIFFLQKNNLPFTFCFYDCINEQGELLNKRVEAPLNLSYKQLFFCNYVGNLTGIYDVDYFGKIPISSIKKRQDWVLWLTVLKKIKVAQGIPESLAYYRIRKNALSASKIQLVQYNFAVYRTLHGLNFFLCCFCIIGFLFTQLLLKPRYIKASI